MTDFVASLVALGLLDVAGMGLAIASYRMFPEMPQRKKSILSMVGAGMCVLATVGIVVVVGIQLVNL